jgi:hypothetical protein
MTITNINSKHKHHGKQNTLEQNPEHPYHRTHCHRNHLRGVELHGCVENKTGVPLETHPFQYL